MPCNCRKCDCSDRKACYKIETRLKSLACIFDKVAEGVISQTDAAVFGAFTEDDSPICDGNTLNALFSLYPDTGSNVLLYSDISAYPPVSFLPESDITEDDNLLEAPYCIPLPRGACQTCNAYLVKVKPICEINSVADSANLENYAFLAQNLRYIASIFGCQTE